MCDIENCSGHTCNYIPSDSVVKGLSLLDRRPLPPMSMILPALWYIRKIYNGSVVKWPQAFRTWCLWAMIIARNLSRKTVLCTCSEVLNVTAWNIRALMDTASQEITLSTLFLNRFCMLIRGTVSSGHVLLLKVAPSRDYVAVVFRIIRDEIM